jgi:hypothetical protein
VNSIEKKNFIRNITDSVADELCIAADKMPEEWDGHELRAPLAEKFAFEVSTLMRDKRSRRVRDYKNEVLVRNL